MIYVIIFKYMKGIYMNNFNTEYYLSLPSCWETLCNTDLPVFIYGMGDGALKILKQFKLNNIACSGFFASDEFVRGHYFEGHLVHRLSEIEKSVGEFIVVLAFAAGYDSLIEKIQDISSRHILFAPDVPVFGDNIFDKNFLRNNSDKIKNVYSLLADNLSKETFKNIIKFKITGRIEPLIKIWCDSNTCYKELIKPTCDEIFVDAGAYKGDTVEEFLYQVNNKYKKIYALEPNIKNYKKLYLSTESLLNVETFNCAVWDKDTTLAFSSGPGRQSSITEKGKETKAESIDNILKGQKATYIKYDVEGAEKQALMGASYTIKKFKPKLKVALYHRSEDIFLLPLLINKLNPEYKLYIRQHKYIPAWEINLFAL